MGKLCSVLYCDSENCKKSDGITWHRYPVNHPHLLAKWKIITGRDKTWKPTLTHFVCSVHFHPSCFIEGQIRRLQPNSVPTRIKLTQFLKKRQPMQYEFIRRQLLSQPGITKVEMNDIVTCEFDKEALEAFAVPSSGKNNQQTGKKKRSKKRKRSKVETSSDEDELSNEEDEVETNIIWNAAIKQEVDPLLIDTSDAPPSDFEDNQMSEDPLRTDTPPEDISEDPLQNSPSEDILPEPIIVDPSLIIASAKDSLQPEPNCTDQLPRDIPEDVLPEPIIVDPSLIIASAKDSLQPEPICTDQSPRDIPEDVIPEPIIVDPSLIIASANDSLQPETIFTDRSQRDSPELTTTNPKQQKTTPMEQQEDTALRELPSEDSVHEEIITINPLQVDETNLIPTQDLQSVDL